MQTQGPDIIPFGAMALAQCPTPLLLRQDALGPIEPPWVARRLRQRPGVILADALHLPLSEFSQITLQIEMDLVGERVAIELRLQGEVRLLEASTVEDFHALEILQNI